MVEPELDQDVSLRSISTIPSLRRLKNSERRLTPRDTTEEEASPQLVKLQETPMEQALSVLHTLLIAQLSAGNADVTEPLRWAISLLLKSNREGFTVDVRDQIEHMEGQGAQIDSEVKAYMMETASSDVPVSSRNSEASASLPAARAPRKISNTWVLPPEHLGRLPAEQEEQEQRDQTLPSAVILALPQQLQPLHDALARAALLQGDEQQLGSWGYDVALLDRETDGHALSLVFLHSAPRVLAA